MRDPVTQARLSVGVSALLPYLRQRSSLVVAAALLSLVAAGSTLVQPLLIRRVLDGVIVAEPVAGTVALLAALLLVAAVLNGVRSFLIQLAAEGLVLATRRRLAGHLLRLPIAEYDRRRTGDLLSRVGADTSLLRMVITSGLLDLGSGVVFVVGAAIMMVVIDPIMFALTVTSLVGLTGAILVARRVRGVSEQVQTRLGEMSAATERAIAAVRTIRAATAEDREAAVIGASAERAYRAGVRMARLQATVGPLVVTAVQGGYLAVLGFGALRVAAGAMSLGDLVAFVLFLVLLTMPIGQAINAYTMVQAGLGALQRIEEVVAIPPESSADPVRAVAPAGAAPAIEFDRVQFAYPDGPPVLDHVGFTVPAGSTTALVGPSGAGKSTVLALVERFYDATGGAVRVNGVDVREQPRAELRRQLGYVEQDAPALAGTIRDNLLLAAPDADDARLLAVLDQVNLTDLVDRAPDGLDAEVGEGGVLLSGGERQRLAIARTLLAGAPILLLDEPTSNLDSRNEHAFRQAIKAAAQQRTVLVVAHRLATVIDADQIVVLERGRVTAAGRHRDLASTNPLYRELATHQLLLA